MMRRSGGSNTVGLGGPGGERRKKKQVNDPESSDVTLQKVDIRFRPVEIGTSVLLHSENQDFIHQLMVS